MTYFCKKRAAEYANFKLDNLNLVNILLDQFYFIASKEESKRLQFKF